MVKREVERKMAASLIIPWLSLRLIERWSIGIVETLLDGLYDLGCRLFVSSGNVEEEESAGKPIQSRTDIVPSYNKPDTCTMRQQQNGIQIMRQQVLITIKRSTAKTAIHRKVVNRKKNR